jgi:Tfp pilus assembly protein PilE
MLLNKNPIKFLWVWMERAAARFFFAALAVRCGISRKRVQPQELRQPKASDRQGFLPRKKRAKACFDHRTHKNFCFMHNKGTTLIELIVALCVTGAIAVLVFGFYTNVIKGYWHMTQKSEGVKEMINAKIKMDRKLSSIQAVRTCRSTSLEYVKSGTDSMRTIAFLNNVLLDNSDTVFSNITTFSYSLVPITSDKSGKQGLLLWEAVLGKDRWIAGSRYISVIDSI